ncbi:MAG: substrate-binding domain-containing protein [Bacilli bacterium]|nr:substrate-binding domain-containing protein [Bacilli bacterium]
MKQKGLLFTSLSIITATSCSLFAKHIWHWDVSTKGNNINYCLLIGQLDHDDSMQRTGGIRDKLDTRTDEAHRRSNKNLEDPKTGHLTFGGDEYQVEFEGKTYTAPEKEFTINELEHAEQKSLSGSNWDPITANATTGTWISKHGKNITMFVSNNDAMSEGALKACNWYQGMPIFGYDANTSALELVKAGRIMGSVDSTTYGQALASAILTRNIYEANKKVYPSPNGLDTNLYSRVDWFYKGWGDPLGNYKSQLNDKYDPIREGFIAYDMEGKEIKPYYGETREAKENRVRYPKLDKNGKAIELPEPGEYGEQFELAPVTGHMLSPINYDDASHGVLLRNRAVTVEAIKKGDGYEDDFESISVLDFFKEDEKTGEWTALNYPEIYDKFEGYKAAEEAGHNPIKFSEKDALSSLYTWQSWGIGSDPYFKTNLNLHFNTVFGGRDALGNPAPSDYEKLHPDTGRMFNLTISPSEGDGNDEARLLNSLGSALSIGPAKAPKAYLINVIRQPNAPEYVKKFETAPGWDIKPHDNWNERSGIPIIFWNRRPGNENAVPFGQDKDDPNYLFMKDNKYFKYVYYVGFDPEQGGKLQGSLIVDWLNRKYIVEEGEGTPVSEE